MRKIIVIISLCAMLALSACDGSKSISDTMIVDNPSISFFDVVMCDLANMCQDSTIQR